jgi:hypothetical protein
VIREEAEGVQIVSPGERMRIVKRDVAAAIIFLATGLLFYWARAEGPLKKEVSSQGDCSNAEAMRIGGSTVEAPEQLIFADSRSRDL